MNALRLMLATLTLSLVGAANATAADLYPWNNHAAPYTFLFGNDIDTHQQTQQLPDGSLSGFFYVSFTGVVTKDGYRVATHVDCNSAACSVGWLLSGQPRTATFLYQVVPDHPVFLVNRLDIPEPGTYAHFHWLGGMPDAGKSSTVTCCSSRQSMCFASCTMGLPAPRRARRAAPMAGSRSIRGSTSRRTSTSLPASSKAWQHDPSLRRLTVQR